MRILVDADSCPVLDIIEKIARNYNLDLLIFSDIYHNIKSDYGKIKKVDRKDEEADMILFNHSRSRDIVITQDYGLAAMLLSKDCKVINNKGQIFSDDNIDYLLMKRHHNSKLRRAGKKHPTAKKRKKKDDIKFKKSLEKIIKLNSKENDKI
ncbi:MAG: YaiI/YqxD family protein [Bacillota bacterium]